MTASQYADDVRARGGDAFVGASGDLWLRTNRVAYVRQPVFRTTPIDGRDLAAVWRRRGLVADFVTEPDPRSPANAVVYVRSAPYRLEDLPSGLRRNVRRGLTELEFEDLGHADLERLGERCFTDTRRRNGLSSDTRDDFLRHVRDIALPQTRIVGAWRGGELVAYLRVLRVDDWADVQPFSSDAGLTHRPNDTLLFRALDEYLADGVTKVVTYGLSSVQEGVNEGLHRFKLKLGFEAAPVHRAIVVRPLLRPILGGIRIGVAATARVAPRHPLVRKANGALALMRAPRP